MHWVLKSYIEVLLCIYTILNRLIGFQNKMCFDFSKKKKIHSVYYNKVCVSLTG